MTLTDLSAGWSAALQEAWDAYCAGSYAIGACVIDAQGTVIARGRNRLGEPRGAEGGMIWRTRRSTRCWTCGTCRAPTVTAGRS